MDNLLSQIGVLWARLSIGQKTQTIVVTVFACIALALVMLWAQQPDYSLLYSRLEPEEAGTIAEKLEETGVPYRLAHNGTAILVPSKDVYELRLRMARDGLPEQGGIGYEIFDKTNLGMSDFLQKVSRQRALEGELTRTIQAMEEILQARVHLVIPEPSLFEDEQKEATASVLVKLRQPGMLGRRKVQGISNLLARSVEGLRPENVTIVDFAGNILSDNLSDDPLTALSNSQMETQRAVEASLENDIEDLLEGALGKGKVLARASVELNFEKIEKTTEKYDPESVVVRSEERMKESGSDPSSKRESTTTNYEINKTVERVENAIGNIEKLSVGVLVDGTYETVTSEAGDEERRYVPRSDEELRKFTSIVKSAVGYDAERGDQVDVASMPFENGHVEQEDEHMVRQERNELWMKIAERSISWILVLGILAVLYLHLKKLAAKASEGKLFPVSQLGTGGPRASNDREGSLPVDFSVPRTDSSAQGQLASFARQNPSATSELLKSWIREQGASDEVYSTPDT